MINDKHTAVVNLLLEKMNSPEYKNVLRNGKDHYDFFPSFGHAELERCKGNANYLSGCVEGCVIDFKLEQDDKNLIEQFLTDSSSSVMESSFFDFKSIAFIGFLIAIYTLIISISFHSKIEFTIWVSVINGILLVILTGFAWLGVRRRISMLKVSEQLKRLAIYFKS